MPSFTGLTVNLTARIENGIAGHDAPRTATEAAALLTAQGRHVHVVSEGDARCTDGQCTPAIVAGLLAAAARPRPRIDSLFPLT